MSDNRPQFSSEEFKTFTHDWNFQHVTSSPRYPRSNGFIERTIQTVKLTMQKAKRSNIDMDLALLCIRSTPIDGTLPTSAEILSGRKIRSNLPMKITNNLHNKDAIQQRLQERQTTQKLSHDYHYGG